MGHFQVYDFGDRDGVKSYRVSGSKEDLYRVLDECREMDCRFDDTPILTHVRKGQWTMMLRIKVAVEVGGEG